MSEAQKNTAPGVEDQERTEIVSRYGDTEVQITKEIVTLSVR